MNGRKDRLRCNSKLTAGGGGSRVKLHRCGHGGEERETSCSWGKESGGGSWPDLAVLVKLKGSPYPHASSALALCLHVTGYTEAPRLPRGSGWVTTGSGDRWMNRHLDWKEGKERAASFITNESLICGQFIAVARKRSITHLIVRGALCHTQLISIKSSINLSLAPSSLSGRDGLCSNVVS